MLRKMDKNIKNIILVQRKMDDNIINRNNDLKLKKTETKDALFRHSVMSK